MADFFDKTLEAVVPHIGHNSPATEVLDVPVMGVHAGVVHGVGQEVGASNQMSNTRIYSDSSDVSSEQSYMDSAIDFLKTIAVDVVTMVGAASAGKIVRAAGVIGYLGRLAFSVALGVTVRVANDSTTVDASIFSSSFWYNLKERTRFYVTNTVYEQHTLDSLLQVVGLLTANTLGGRCYSGVRIVGQSVITCGERVVQMPGIGYAAGKLVSLYQSKLKDASPFHQLSELFRGGASICYGLVAGASTALTEVAVRGLRGEEQKEIDEIAVNIGFATLGAWLGGWLGIYRGSIKTDSLPGYYKASAVEGAGDIGVGAATTLGECAVLGQSMSFEDFVRASITDGFVNAGAGYLQKHTDKCFEPHPTVDAPLARVYLRDIDQDRYAGLRVVRSRDVLDHPDLYHPDFIEKFSIYDPKYVYNSDPKQLNEMANALGTPWADDLIAYKPERVALQHVCVLLPLLIKTGRAEETGMMVPWMYETFVRHDVKNAIERSQFSYHSLSYIYDDIVINKNEAIGEEFTKQMRRINSEVCGIVASRIVRCKYKVSEGYKCDDIIKRIVVNRIYNSSINLQMRKVVEEAIDSQLYRKNGFDPIWPMKVELPWATILAGGAGSGKSTMAIRQSGRAKRYLKLTAEDFYTCNHDVIKFALGGPIVNYAVYHPSGGNFLSDEAHRVVNLRNQEITRRAQENHSLPNMILEEIRFQGITDALGRTGYQPHVRIVDVPIEEAYRRTIQRGKGRGTSPRVVLNPDYMRLLNLAALVSTHQQTLEQALATIQKSAGMKVSLKVYRNIDKTRPYLSRADIGDLKVIDVNGKTSTIHIYNPKYFMLWMRKKYADGRTEDIGDLYQPSDNKMATEDVLEFVSNLMKQDNPYSVVVYHPEFYTRIAKYDATANPPDTKDINRDYKKLSQKECLELIRFIIEIA